MTCIVILQEVVFMLMDSSKSSILEGFERLLGKILIPALQQQEVLKT